MPIKKSTLAGALPGQGTNSLVGYFRDYLRTVRGGGVLRNGVAAAVLLRIEVYDRIVVFRRGAFRIGDMAAFDIVVDVDHV